METIVKQRLTGILDEQKKTLNAISGGDNALRMAMTRQLRGDAALTYSTIACILQNIPTLNVDWVFFGRGEKYLTDDQIRGFDEHSLIARQQREIDGLYERIAELKKDMEFRTQEFDHSAAAAQSA